MAAGHQGLNVDHIDAYYGEAQALFKVSIFVLEKETVSILGANAAGKSTLLKTISGLLAPASGTITFYGKRIDGMRPFEISRLGLVLIPEGKRVFPNLTVYENLWAASTTPESKAKREDSLELVYNIFPRIKERRNQRSGSLSGGERQMLAISMGLMMRPRFLMLDEPSQGLSPLLVEELFVKIPQIKDVYGLSVLLVEQHVQESLRISDRGYVLENGRIMLEGAAQELMENKQIRSSYIGL